MRGRNWAIVIAVNVVLSAAVVVAVLLASGRLPSRSSSTETVIPQAPTSGLALATPSSTSDREADTQAIGQETPSAPAPFVHTVEQGDTLSAIAETYGTSVGEIVALNQLTNPNLLRLGQELLIPAGSEHSPTGTPPSDIPTEASVETEPPPEAADIAVPTPTSSGPPLIEIAQVLGSAILGEEMVVIRNRGGAASLENWTLSDGTGSSFVFPAVRLYPSSELRLHSRTGTNRPSDLYWGLVEAAWQGGALVTMRDAEGEVVDTYIVP